jgi:hypothetical protein
MRWIASPPFGMSEACRSESDVRYRQRIGASGVGQHGPGFASARLAKRCPCRRSISKTCRASASRMICSDLSVTPSPFWRATGLWMLPGSPDASVHARHGLETERLLRGERLESGSHLEPMLPHAQRMAAFGKRRRGPVRQGWVGSKMAAQGGEQTGSFRFRGVHKRTWQSLAECSVMNVSLSSDRGLECRAY